MHSKKIQILAYPGASKSAQYGMRDMFSYVDRLARTENHAGFDCQIVNAPNWQVETALKCDILILPPSFNRRDFLAPDLALNKTLRQLHATGTIIASACAGAFLIAHAGLCNDRTDDHTLGVRVALSRPLFEHPFGYRSNPDQSRRHHYRRRVDGMD